MAHLLKTMNKEIAEHLDEEGQPRPGLGEMVIYYPRPGELRAGAGHYTAIVTRVNEDDTLDLVVVYDADDLVGQRHIPRRSPDGGLGWERIARKKRDDAAGWSERVRSLEEQVAMLTKVLLGGYEAPRESILQILDEHEDRLEAIAPTLSAARPEASKPKKPKQKQPKAAAKAAPKPPAIGLKRGK